MTSSTTDKASSNGTSTPTNTEPSEREHGITRVQEEQVYHVTGLAEAALYEAERLMNQLKTSAMRRTSDYDGTNGTTPMDMAQVSAVLSEALDCIDVASEQLSRLDLDIRIRLEPDHGF